LAWEIRITRTAEKQISRLDQVTQKRLLKFFTRLNQRKPKQLGKALQGDKAEFWRYRVGDYRLICTVDDNLAQVLVLEVGHRREVYR